MCVQGNKIEEKKKDFTKSVFKLRGSKSKGKDSQNEPTNQGRQNTGSRYQAENQKQETRKGIDG